MDDFLYILKLQLMDHLMPQELDEQIQLYENYINEEIAGGKTLEQVMRKLGDPVKVAEMIIAHKNDEDLSNAGSDNYLGDQKTVEKADRTSQRADSVNKIRDMTAAELNEQIHNPKYGIHAEFKENEGWDIRLGKLKLNTWYGTFLILGVVLVIFVLISELTH